MKAPRMIIVSGAPATGKSTLALRLSEALGIPLIAKDRFKEAMFDTLGTKDREWSKMLGGASMRLLYDAAADHLRVGCSVILESNFKPERDTAALDGLARNVGAVVTQIYCRADDEIRLDRIRDRVSTGERHVGHDDAAYLREGASTAVASVDHGIMNLEGDRIEVDMNDFSSVDISRLISAISL